MCKLNLWIFLKTFYFSLRQTNIELIHLMFVFWNVNLSCKCVLYTLYYFFKLSLKFEGGKILFLWKFYVGTFRTFASNIMNVTRFLKSFYQKHKYLRTKVLYFLIHWTVPLYPLFWDTVCILNYKKKKRKKNGCQLKWYCGCIKPKT